VLGRVASAMPMWRVAIQRPSLEDLFIDIVKRQGEEDVEGLRAAMQDAGQLVGAGAQGGES